VPVVTCPACRNDLHAPDGSEGQPVRCPKCRTRFSVPDRRPALPPDEAGSAPRSKSPALAARGRFLAAVFASVALVTLILLVSLLAPRYRDPVPCEVLDERRTPAGKLALDLLVSPSMTRADALTLAEARRRRHAGDYATICVFDDREAWRRHLDPDYPEKTLSRHWLVVVTPDRGVCWVAEGRDH
jgi:LSD1 subclass zinc finger protein